MAERSMTPAQWYNDHIGQSLDFESLIAICPFTVIRIKPTMMQVDIMILTMRYLIRHIEDEYPHLAWVRTLNTETVSGVYTRNLAGCITKPKSATFLRGFIFCDPVDAVTFKLLWSEYLF